MIRVRVFNLGTNFAVPMNVPLDEILHLRKLIIIWGEVYLCWSCDPKDLCNVIWSNEEFISLDPTL